MILRLTYSVDSVYDELMRYGWALMSVGRVGTPTGMGFEYGFSGGGFFISLIQTHTGRYFVRIYDVNLKRHWRRVIAVSDSIISYSPKPILQISTGDMIRLLYGDPLTFRLRLEQYKVEAALEEL